ncbi:MAG: hypothetical protein C4339_06085 [Nitrososphaerota archaeon]
MAEAGRWETRWVLAAIVQGALAALLVFYVVVSHFGLLKPEVSRVIAAGGAGTWLSFGFLAYLIVGVVGSAVTALFYHHIEGVRQVPITGIRAFFAWVHLIFGNAGSFAATWMMMYGGYLGGAALLPPQVGGWGWTPLQVHERILGPLVTPIALAILVLLAGFLSGGLAYVLSLREASKRK